MRSSTATAAPSSARTLAVDAIVVTAGATHVPTTLLRYLKPGGRMVLPLAQPDDDERGVQRLTVLDADARRPPGDRRSMR